MTLEQVLNWLLLPALGGLAWIARLVSRLETEVTNLQNNVTELWKHNNKHAEDITDVAKTVSNLQGRLEK